MNNHINIKWLDSYIGEKFFSKSAIYIPIEIEDLKGDFFVQLDTGSNTTILYDNALKSLIKGSNILESKIDYSETSNTSMLSHYWIRKLNFNVARQSCTKDIIVYKDFGSWNGIDTATAIQEIGTVGNEIFKDKILYIDFRNNRLAIIDKVTPEFQSNFFTQKMQLADNKPTINLTINNKLYRFLFDTGSSIFPIITAKNKWAELSNHDDECDYINEINAWDKKVTAKGKNILGNVYFEDMPLENKKIYTLDYDELADYFNKINVTGIVGNAYFFDKEIMIDYNNLTFGVR